MSGIEGPGRKESPKKSEEDTTRRDVTAGILALSASGAGVAGSFMLGEKRRYESLIQQEAIDRENTRLGTGEVIDKSTATSGNNALEFGTYGALIGSIMGPSSAIAIGGGFAAAGSMNEHQQYVLQVKIDGKQTVEVMVPQDVFNETKAGDVFPVEYVVDANDKEKIKRANLNPRKSGE